MARRRIHSVADELINKAREAALCAIQTYNNPLVIFKSETYIVLMIIAWTYLLHAYYRKRGVEYRYYRQVGKRRIFDKTKKGAHKHWELERCLNNEQCPIDRDTRNNLRFLIGLRHEIEHQMTHHLDDYLSGRYQACALNFNRYIKDLFGEKYGLDSHVMFCIQVSALSYEQFEKTLTDDQLPPKLRAYIFEFDSSLTPEEYDSDYFSFRLHFTKKMVNRPGQADRVIEFLDPNSDAAQEIEPEYWVRKEVERPKYLPSEICTMMHNEGFPHFKVHHHTDLWKSYDAKKPGKGYGVQIGKQWYWYDRWLEVVREHCKKNAEKYS